MVRKKTDRQQAAHGSTGDAIPPDTSETHTRRSSHDEEQRRLQSEKMVAVSALAAEIAHEINNPLHYISNYLYLLSMELPQDFRGAEYVQKIQSGIDALAEMMRSLLAFSRPPQDVFTPVDVHHALNAAISLSEQELSAHQIRLERQFRCGSPKVQGSERHLVQAFHHVVRNALEAMTPQGILRIETGCAHGKITAQFSDTGCGIPEKDLSRVFDPFFTTKKNSQQKGRGLGLAICFNILKHHNGAINVLSRVGSGTTVTIVLPKL